MNWPKSMRKPRRAAVTHGPGECWYYVGPRGLEISVATRKGEVSSNVIRLTRRQLERALVIMEDAGVVSRDL